MDRRLRSKDEELDQYTIALKNYNENARELESLQVEREELLQRLAQKKDEIDGLQIKMRQIEESISISLEEKDVQLEREKERVRQLLNENTSFNITSSQLSEEVNIRDNEIEMLKEKLAEREQQ